MKMFGKIIGMIAVGLFISQLSSAQLINGTLHDFEGLGWTNTQNGLCGPCHTPHQAFLAATAAPLWAHQISSAGFTPYPTGGTMQSTPGQPDGVSAQCLGCHDGATGLDNFIPNLGTNTTNIASASSTYVGVDLSNDHPVSMLFDAALFGSDAGLHDPTGTVTTLGGNDIQTDYLFADKVQCASCHNPHNNEFGAFLRMDNVGSALCLDCHNK